MPNTPKEFLQRKSVVSHEPKVLRARSGSIPDLSNIRSTDPSSSERSPHHIQNTRETGGRAVSFAPTITANAPPPLRRNNAPLPPPPLHTPYTKRRNSTLDVANLRLNSDSKSSHHTSSPQDDSRNENLPTLQPPRARKKLSLSVRQRNGYAAQRVRSEEVPHSSNSTHHSSGAARMVVSDTTNTDTINSRRIAQQGAVSNALHSNMFGAPVSSYSRGLLKTDGMNMRAPYHNTRFAVEEEYMTTDRYDHDQGEEGLQAYQEDDGSRTDTSYDSPEESGNDQGPPYTEMSDSEVENGFEPQERRESARHRGGYTSADN